VIPVVPILRILWAFAPIVRDVIKASRKNSDGGKRITREEWRAILGAHEDDVLDDVNTRLST